MSLLRRVAAASKGDGREGASPAVRSPMEGQVATARVKALRSERVRVTRLMMERVGFTEVARIVAMADARRARLELRPALEAVINADGKLDVTGPERELVITDVL